jgi:hypothetical protein
MRQIAPHQLARLPARPFTTLSPPIMPGNAQIDPLLSELFERSPLPPLEPGKTVYSTSLQTRIKSLQTAPVVKAALNLANDDIKGCHDIVEKMQGESTADCLHAILHRREGELMVDSTAMIGSLV